MFSVLVIKDFWLIMNDSVNIRSLIVNDVKEAVSKFIPEKSRKRYFKECELFGGEGWLGFPDLWSSQNPDGTDI